MDKTDYSKYLKKYLKVFPKKQLEIIIYDEFEKNNLKIFREVCKFLGIDEGFKPIITRRNPSKTLRNNIFSKLIVKLPMYTLQKWVEILLPKRIKNKISDFIFKLIFKKGGWEIRPEIKDKLKKKLKLKVKETNKLLNKRGLIDKNLVEYWRY